MSLESLNLAWYCNTSELRYRLQLHAPVSQCFESARNPTLYTHNFIYAGRNPLHTSSFYSVSHYSCCSMSTYVPHSHVSSRDFTEVPPANAYEFGPCSYRHTEFSPCGKRGLAILDSECTGLGLCRNGSTTLNKRVQPAIMASVRHHLSSRHEPNSIYGKFGVFREKLGWAMKKS